MARQRAQLPVGIVGLGQISSQYASRIRANRRARLVGGFDLDAGRREEFAGRFNTQAFSSLEDLLARVEAVCVCTWPGAHVQVAEAALRAGKAVIAEKPPGTNALEVRSLLETASAQQSLLTWMFQYRAMHRGLQGWLEEFGERLGELLYVRAVWIRRVGGEEERPEWPRVGRPDPLGQGSLADLGAHLLDFAWCHMGRPNPKVALPWADSLIAPTKGMTERLEAETHAATTYHFRPGITGRVPRLEIRTAFAANFARLELAEVIFQGTRAGIQIPLMTTPANPKRYRPVITSTSARGIQSSLRLDGPLPIPTVEAHGLVLDRFVDACRGDGDPLVPAEDGYGVQVLIDMFYVGAEQGEPVILAADGSPVRLPV
jgi:predicted dehydrogenase